MKLSRTVAYAVQAVLQLAQHEGAAPVPCSKLAAEGQMPERFLLQILRNLVTHGLLRSTRGVDGGYALARSAHEISLLELIEAIEGPLETPKPESEARLPPAVQGKLYAVLDSVNEAARTQLAAVSLAQLLPDPKR